MAIDFGPERWADVRDTYRKWWAGELDRPIVPMIVFGRDPGREQPAAPTLDQSNCTDLDIPPEDLIDRLDYDLSCRWFLGDAYPRIEMSAFGPGVAAAFLGARLDGSTGQVWFHPARKQPIRDIHFEYDPDNVWLKRIKDICRAGVERWNGKVLISMTDLGGNLDVLSTFRPAEQLLLDLYDDPDEVIRVTWEAHEMWHRFHGEIHEIIGSGEHGYSDWAQLYCDEPSYMLQCDFCYMIGPEMFDGFVKPELEATTKRLARSFYHLDGPGQLPHLDSVLTIPDLDGVQWVPGAGAKPPRDWPEVYEEIHAAGKKIQMLGDLDDLNAIIKRLGGGKGMQMIQAFAPSQDEARARLARFGVDS